MAQQKPSWKTSPDPEWRTRRPMTDSEARQIRAKNLKEAKAGGFKGDLTIKPAEKPTKDNAKTALKKAANEAGLAAREERLRMQLREDIKAGEPARQAEMARIQARRAGGEAARKAGYEVSDKFNFRDSISVNDPRPFTKFEKLQKTADTYFRNPPPGKFATVEPMAPPASSGKFATVERGMAPPASSGKFATVEPMAPPASSGKFATVTRMAPAAAEGKFATAAAPSMAGRMLRGAGRMVGRAAGPVGVAMTAYDLAKAFPAPAPMNRGEREEAARSYRTGPQPKSENMRALAKAKAEMSKGKKGK